MAKEFGVAVTSYSRWEDGTECNFETLVKISIFYGITIDDLLKIDLSQEDISNDKLKTTGPLEKGQVLSTEDMKLLNDLQQTLREQSELIKKLSDQVSDLQVQMDQQAQEIIRLKKDKPD